MSCNDLNHPHIELDDCPLLHGEHYVVSSTVTGGTPQYLYYWTGDYNGRTPDANVQSDGTCTAYQLQLMVIDAMGCTDTAWRNFVTVDELPPNVQHPETHTANAIPLGKQCLYTMRKVQRRGSVEVLR